MTNHTPETLIIGSKFWGHDSSVFMVMPKEKHLCALQTERVTRYKHDRTFATPAIEKLIEREHIVASEVKKVIFCNSFEVLEDKRLPENLHDVEMLYRKHFKSPYQKDIETARDRFHSLSKPQQLIGLCMSAPGLRILLEKLLMAVGIKKIKLLSDIERASLARLFPNADIEIRFYEHEYCHAACVALTAPFDSGLLCTMDGWGDKSFSRVYKLAGNALTEVAHSPRTFEGRDPRAFGSFLPSVGGIYSYFTEQLGFVPEQDEGKVEALAAYGKPVPALVAALSATVKQESDLSLSVDTNAFVATFGPEKFENLKQQYSREELSATVQAFLEQVMHSYISALVEKTGLTNLALAGGVAANVINNLSLYERITPNLHITPAMGDDGSAQGAAYAYLLESGEDVSWIKKLEMPYYETSYVSDEVKAVLKKTKGITFKNVSAAWPEEAAALVAAGKIGAIFHGRAEWGPRALGHRSIIADVRHKDFRDIINKTIKRRPLFQPFCPSMLAEERERLFESAYLNKHMTTAFRLKKEFWDVIPSAIHIDGTARVQFVEEKDDASYYRLLKKVKELTGFGVIINTSFNKHGRTIVESPQDAIDDFLDTDMDYLLIEGFLVTRKA